MIEVKEFLIGPIPVVEVVDTKLKEQALPLVLFYHGWTNSKDESVAYGVELAKKGIRAVLPDAVLHGQRKREQGTLGQEFWQVVGQNIMEFPTIISYYQEKNLILDQKIGVSGLSMGGITTYALLTQFDWIKAACSLMGNPDPVGFSKWTLDSPWSAGLSVEEPSDSEATELFTQLSQISLRERPELINQRPLLLWHDTDDIWVPYDQNFAFYQDIKGKEFAKKVEWVETSGYGHKVPFTITQALAEFFAREFDTLK
ncbi:prolyl oligopeptidase family serine peptidase [Granulicatella seriolae]|uniref:Prolyl oligopeptidase family serine peptidase n=1 Tax=Granulicatella seriolae TaxID=2967226 RepID=A0ABT1WMM3_9LACT|nr:prolyl oligopeptidase family serine peptidase [Granulicatella seriolae]